MVLSMGSVADWVAAIAETTAVLAILWQGGKALRAYNSDRLLRAIDYVEEAAAREARTRLRQRLSGEALEKTKWWEEDAELERDAGFVCSRYNLLGALSSEDRPVRRFIVREWRYNIRSTFQLLEPYVGYREAAEGRGVLRHYRDLYEAALADLRARPDA